VVVVAAEVLTFKNSPRLAHLHGQSHPAQNLSMLFVSAAVAVAVLDIGNHQAIQTHHPVAVVVVVVVELRCGFQLFHWAQQKQLLSAQAAMVALRERLTVQLLELKDLEQEAALEAG
jgi:hypothetical protein